MNVCPAMVAVPVLSASVFAATASCTVPFPDPLLSDEMLIQLALLAAVQPQPAGAVTPTDAVPPALLMFCVDGEIANEHPASCVTVKVWSPAVMVPVRGGPALAATAYWTDPFPVPVEPAVTLSQLALLDALQLQPAAVPTSNRPAPPPAGADADAGERANVQPWP